MTARARSWATRAGAALLVLGCAALLLSDARHFGLVAPDSYPLVAASRVSSLAGLGAVLAAPLGGAWLEPVFYRPLVHLSFALDHALWGLRPFGYQLGNVLLFAAACAALFQLAARLLPPSARGAAALVVLVSFALHPAHAVVVPVPARRAELLCVLFMSLALAAQLRRAERAPGRPAVGAGLLGLAALGSKETAFALPLLAFGAAWLGSPSGSWRGRLRQAGVASLPLWVLAAGFLGLRLAVLGGLAGERPLDVAGLAGRLQAVPVLLARLVSGRAALASAPLPALSLAALTLAGVLAAAGAGARVRAVAARAAAPTLALGLLWVALCALLYALGAGLQAWYALVPAAGLALAAGGAFAGLRELTRAGGAARIGSLAGLVCLALVLAAPARYSPVLRDYPQWRRATRITDRYFERLRARIERAPAGSVVRAAPPPIRVPGELLEGTVLLAPYSVAAWAALAFPERRIRVVASGAGSEPLPGEVVVELAAPRPVPQGR